MKFILCIMIVFVFSGAALSTNISDIKLDELKKPPEAIWGRDPFLTYEDRYRKEAPPEEARPDFKIDGIISNGRKALVIIDGGFYRKGDVIYDFRIADISKDTVLLEREGMKYRLGIEKFAIERGKR
jgi:hypothetical protein